jgi:O-antigen ligase/tetratricopeptide (TPR) repeat protein
MQSTTVPTNISDTLYSLSVSGVLLAAFVYWLVWRLWTGKLSFYSTGIEVGLLLLCAAIVISGFIAPDKRMVITYAALLVTPALMALLLVHVLDSPSKTSALLATIAALGIVNTYEGADQFFSSNQVTIEQYEQNPQSLLEPLGIEKGTLQHFLLEHRLYSKGVRGYFTTRNSAGSFLLMSLFAAAALLVERMERRRLQTIRPAFVLAAAAMVVVILCGLVLTKSKGAILGLLFAAAVLLAYRQFGRWLYAHRRLLLFACAVSIVASVCVVISYGLSHDRLPGGNSMLVRWQYWRASAKMYAHHPLTGVGAGNFAHFYTRYKPPAALESVADPHNFVLSILTQIGPLGLVGFLIMLAGPLSKVHRPLSSDNRPAGLLQGPAPKVIAVLALIATCATTLLIRPFLIPMPQADSFDVLVCLAIALYIAPTIVLLIGLWLLTWPPQTSTGADAKPTLTIPILFCAVLAVLLANLIDFAIFEPPVYTAFWAMIACMLAVHNRTSDRRPFALKQRPVLRILTTALAGATLLAYFNFALLPVAKTTSAMQRAKQAISAGQFDAAYELLDAATKDDTLNSTVPALKARLYLEQFRTERPGDSALLVQAEKYLQIAIERCPASHKNFERLTEVYASLADISAGEQRTTWLGKALDAAQAALERYPGCERLHLDLARVAEQLGKTDLALEHYKRTVEIEDSYRRQFRTMYPAWKELVSRLGNDKYNYALDKIKELSPQ